MKHTIWILVRERLQSKGKFWAKRSAVAMTTRKKQLFMIAQQVVPYLALG